MMATESPEPYCGANKPSRAMADHVHYCRLQEGHACDHLCSKCKRWFWG